MIIVEKIPSVKDLDNWSYYPSGLSKDVAERVIPDILIEDDCESIGGHTEMVYPHIQPELQQRIVSSIVKEFEGIDHLPDAVTDLQGKVI